MARIFITGSADGLGQLAAKELIMLGHKVVLHARNIERGNQVIEKLQGAEDVLIADLSSMEETKALAAKANASVTFDAVIHNAGVYRENSLNAAGLPVLFAVNSLAPYILTCLMNKPERLKYLRSDMHLQGNPNFDNLHVATGERINVTYSDTKLHDLVLAMAVARKWTGVLANAVDPGWVPTNIGGAGAPDSLEKVIRHKYGLRLVMNTKPGQAVTISTTKDRLTFCRQPRLKTYKRSFLPFVNS